MKVLSPEIHMVPSADPLHSGEGSSQYAVMVRRAGRGGVEVHDTEIQEGVRNLGGLAFVLGEGRTGAAMLQMTHS